MHITGMTIGKMPPFAEPVDFKFDKRVNAFIGPNATGKSTLVRVLRKLLMTDLWDERDEFDYLSCKVRRSKDWPLFKNKPIDTYDPERVAWFHDWAAVIGENPDVDAAPVISIPSIRVGMDLQTGFREAHQFMEDTAWEYDRRDRPLPTSVAELLDPQHGEGWPVLYAEATQHATTLALEHAAKLNATGVKNNVHRAILLAQKCAHEICADVLMQGDVPEHRTIVNAADPENEPGGQRRVTQHYTDVSVRYAEDRLPLYLLSSGTENTIWWIRFITLYMAHHYGFVDDWEQQPAILLIDEIENHLHPTWQRRVIPALLEHFPGLQIFATTHSPFVVAGLKAGQVHLLNRDENGVITATTNTEDIVGWTADEILRVYMGVDEPTDEVTAQAARKLRTLRAQPSMTDEREEEERQAEIRRLRQIVDRAELSGPRAAEDARFLADLRSILDRYSRSQDLNQENA